MEIAGKQFQFISRIVPKVDDTGCIIEESPASRYHNVNNLPLHKYGSGPFCHFQIKSPEDGLGVYCMVDESDKLLYVGKCTGPTSTLLKRFNQGYGSIQPRNCYEGGQRTNCRINHLVLEAVKRGEKLSAFFHETRNGEEATTLETELIRRVGKPPWNISEPW